MSDSTVRRQRLRRTELAEAKFQALVESIPDAVVIVDSDGRIVLVNTQIETLFGYNRDELLGKPIEILVPERARKAHVRHRAGYYAQPYTRPIGAGLDGLVSQRKDGSEFPVDISLSPLETDEGILVMATIRDVTERKRAEEALRESEERYRELFENANDIIYTHDLTGRFTSINRAAEQATGYTREEALTENIAGVVAPEHLEEAREMILRKLRREPSTVYELEIITKDGRRVPVEVSTRVIYQDGKPVGVQGIARDITERRQAEEALRRAQTETVMLLAAAAEAHDLTTGLHLQSIRALAEVLALELGYGEEGASALGLAAVLHDIGKVRVPDAMLATTGPLADAAWQVMQQHTVWGEELLAGRPGFELATAIARCHHERWDGGGYPDGLAGDAIPEAATIVAVADAFDAITHDRPYQDRRSVEQAVREIVAETGTQFSPKVVAALERLYRRNALPLMPSRVADQAAA